MSNHFQTIEKSADTQSSLGATRSSDKPVTVKGMLEDKQEKQEKRAED